MSYDPTTRKNLDSWLQGAYDEETKTAIRRLMQEDPGEITDAFYTCLSFGTGGLRGIMGVGSNRINVYTIGAATQGLADYVNKQPGFEREFSVCIGYDSRKHSRLFAEESAKVLAGNGIGVYLFRELRPTPLVSFGCRFKKCMAGIMITASHNPPCYNGYKVYWQDGGQVLPPHDTGIIEAIRLITDPGQVRKTPTLSHPLIKLVDSEIDVPYLEAIDKLQLHPFENKRNGKSLKIVYTSLHGTGITLIPRALQQWGFTNITFVDKQILPDENFPTTSSPNPEDPVALALGIEQLKQEKSDLLIATDPDADRVGIAVMHRGEVRLLTGNQLAAICLEHICKSLNEQNRLPANAGFIKTIATTELFKAIADAYGKMCIDVLTGFKYIAGKIEEWETAPTGPRFLFGGEESNGYLLGTQTRDKDAIVSSALICDMALYAKNTGKTLIDLLHDLYKKYGVYYETLLSIKFAESKTGKEQMAKGIGKLQDSPPRFINGIQVAILEDYRLSIRTDFKTGKTEPLPFPKSDALIFRLEDSSKLLIRPSGTEPKVKIYCGVSEKSIVDISEALAMAEVKARKLVDSLEKIVVD